MASLYLQGVMLEDADESRATLGDSSVVDRAPKVLVPAESNEVRIPSGAGKTNQINLNGSPVTALVTARDVDVTVANGIGTIRALPEYCFGDPSVASEIVNPQTQLILARVGDSRTYQLTTALLQGYAPGLQWAGSGFPWGDYPQDWNTRVTYAQAQTAATSTPFGNLGTLTPQEMHVYTHNGASTGASAQLSQYFFATYAPGTYARHQLAGRRLRFAMLILEGPHSPVAENLYVQVDYVGSTYNSAYFSAYAAEVGVRVVYVDVPNTHNWTTYPTIYPKLMHRSSTATVSGDQVVAIGAALIPLDAGICDVNCGVGGRQTANFADETIFAGSLWGSYFAELGANVGLWIDLGTNGSGDLSTATADAANKLLIAQRFRAQFPNGPIMFTTAFPGGSGGVAGELPGISRGWREGAIAAAAAIPHSFVVDSYNAMPTAAQSTALSYYTSGDYTHYAEAGNQALCGTLATILRKASSRRA